MFVSKSQRTTRGDIAKLSLSGKKSDPLASNKVNASMLDKIPNNTIQLASANLPTVEAGSLPKLSTSPLQQRSDAPFNSQMRTTTIRLNQPINSGLPSNNAGGALGENPQALQLLQNLQSQAQANAATSMGLGIPTPTPTPSASVAPNAGIQNAVQLLESQLNVKGNGIQSAPSLPTPVSPSWSSSLQPMGQSLSTSGWVKPGQAPMPSPLPLTGFQPNQSPALGSTTGR